MAGLRVSSRLQGDGHLQPALWNRRRHKCDAWTLKSCASPWFGDHKLTGPVVTLWLQSWKDELEAKLLGDGLFNIAFMMVLVVSFAG